MGIGGAPQLFSRAPSGAFSVRENVESRVGERHAPEGLFRGISTDEDSAGGGITFECPLVGGVTPCSVPEPTTFVLAALGMTGLCFVRQSITRRRDGGLAGRQSLFAPRTKRRVRGANHDYAAMRRSGSS
ncbi:MAG: PEP-CTERM sorting domain-containing protein [Planctomycetes bacterium]|nr:PEP-CTERM sorting domain-containing protein [Planctomycetota bacterium]